MPYFYFLWFELLTLFIGLFRLATLKNSRLLMFIPFLLLTNIVEWGNRYGLLSIGIQENAILNSFRMIEFLFYAYIFYSFCNTPAHRKNIKLIVMCYLMVAVIDIIFSRSDHQMLSYTFLAGSLMIIYLCCYFYYEIFQAQGYINLLTSPLFWIASGLLFYYLCMFFYYLFYEAYAYKYFSEFMPLFNVLTNIFTILLYSCFSIAFLSIRNKREER